MDRRRFLAVAAGLSSAGCLGARGDGGSGTHEGVETDAVTETRTTIRQYDEISISIATSSPNGTPVQLTVSSEEDTLVEERVVVSPDGATVVDTGIDEEGRYELTITPEGGRTRSYPFRVREFDLQVGTNVVVSIDDDVVRIHQEGG